MDFVISCFPIEKHLYQLVLDDSQILTIQKMHFLKIYTYKGLQDSVYKRTTEKNFLVFFQE